MLVRPCLSFVGLRMGFITCLHENRVASAQTTHIVRCRAKWLSSIKFQTSDILPITIEPADIDCVFSATVVVVVVVVVIIGIVISSSIPP